MTQIEEDGEEFDFKDWARREEEHDLSPAGIAEQNDRLLRQYQEFRYAADAVVAAWQDCPDVSAVALIGSVAVAPWKEVPRFPPFHRARIALWHECKDVDLALWLTGLDDLNGLRRTKDKALRNLFEERGIGIASHQVDVFVLEPGTDRYLRRLCQFNSCPKGKPECLVPGCGATKLLRQHEDFQWRPETLIEGRIVHLFGRSTGRPGSAADLPLPIQGNHPGGAEA